jgi:hypothetical protein
LITATQEADVASTAFYALDQERLPKEEWDLADSFARLHALTSDNPVGGVARITVADLLLALEGWNLVGEREQYARHRAAVARIRNALG